MNLPILVANLTGPQARRVACPDCGYERDASVDEMVVADPGLCSCGGFLDWKYLQADPCLNCGELKTGGWPRVLGGCCSRVCQLQHEYAQQLEARKASA